MRHRVLVLLLVLLGLGRPPARAQRTAPVPQVPQAAVLTDTLVQLEACPGNLRRARVAAIVFAGNAITKERTLRAELDFQEGDSLDLASLRPRLEANRRRLYNLQLFHAVLARATCRDGQLTILFGVEERWYTFPVPILSLAERNIQAWLARDDRWQRIDYGLHLVRSNFRGRNEQLIANLQLGFNRKYELLYEAPGFGRRRRVGVGLGISYYQSHALDYATRQDKLVTFRDDDAFPTQRFYVSGGLRLRSTVQFSSALDLSYNRQRIGDSVNIYNPDYFLGQTEREYLELSLLSTHNQRNTFAYPLTGQFMQAAFSHRFFLNRNMPDLTTLRLRYARYLALGHNFYYSAGLSAQLRFTRRMSYVDSRALGYEALVRGYDRYVIEGRHYLLAQQGLSFRLFSASQIRLPGINNSKFNTLPLVIYLNTFADLGYVAARDPAPVNTLPNSLLAATGLGLHFVTYYDRVVTIEYTLNGRGETGYFFRTAFPI